jgi:hypothetical protein
MMAEQACLLKVGPKEEESYGPNAGDSDNTGDALISLSARCRSLERAREPAQLPSKRGLAPMEDEGDRAAADRGSGAGPFEHKSYSAPIHQLATRS